MENTNSFQELFDKRALLIDYLNLEITKKNKKEKVNLLLYGYKCIVLFKLYRFKLNVIIELRWLYKTSF